MLAYDNFKSTEAAILTKTTINLNLNSAYRCAAKEAKLNFNANYIEMYSYKIKAAWSLMKQINQSGGERGTVSSISPQTSMIIFTALLMALELKLLRLILLIVPDLDGNIYKLRMSLQLGTFFQLVLF